MNWSAVMTVYITQFTGKGKMGICQKKEETPNWLTAANLTVLTVVALIECKLIFDGTHVQTNFLVACSTLLNHSVAYTELV
jgi:hypothetical protein